MQLLLEAVRPDEWGGLSVRVLAVNNSYEPVRLDRRLLIGPNPVSSSRLVALARETPAESEADNFVVLAPWSVYGRQRRCPPPTDGPVTIHAYLFRGPADTLRPDGPSEPSALEVAAEPLVLAP